MLHGVLIVLAVGFLAGEVASRLRLPRLIGMLIAGIAIGLSVLDVLPQPVLDSSSEIRLFTLLVILLKAGLGLDKKKILAQGSVAIRLGFRPGVIEAAVIVPVVLRRKAHGLGVKKAFPT